MHPQYPILLSFLLWTLSSSLQAQTTPLQQKVNRLHRHMCESLKKDAQTTVPFLLKKVIAQEWMSASAGQARQISRAIFPALTLTAGKHPQLTLHSRHDLLLHFLAGIQLGQTLPESMARRMATWKEELDAQPGPTNTARRPSGYDFNDLAATRFGIVLGRRLGNLTAAQAIRFLQALTRDRHFFPRLCPITQLPHLTNGNHPTSGQLASAEQRIRQIEQSIEETLQKVLQVPTLRLPQAES